jgi:hypothetical protein
VYPDPELEVLDPDPDFAKITKINEEFDSVHDIKVLLKSWFKKPFLNSHKSQE